MSRTNQQEMHDCASRCLAGFRQKSYDELVELVKAEHVETHAFKGSGSSRYQVEVTFLWDDRESGEIRVDATVDEDPHRPLFGILPVYVSCIGDGFIMKPDGSFIDE